MVTIYALRCERNGFTYVGCTQCSLAKRMREHRCRLNKGTHRTAALLEDWRIFGKDAFSTLTLETLNTSATIEEKRSAELRWMRHFAAIGKLYNEHIISFRPADHAIAIGVAASRAAVGNRWSTETNLKRRLAQLGKPKGHGAKISATKLAKREQMKR